MVFVVFGVYVVLGDDALLPCRTHSSQRLGILCRLVFMYNKKVLLRERKRHTDRRVASTRYAALPGVGTPTPVGVPPPPASWMGYPPRPAGWGTPPPASWMGYPPGQLDGVPPPASWMGYPPASWMGYPPPASWMGTPPRPLRCELTDKLKILPPLVLRTRSVTTIQAG